MTSKIEILQEMGLSIPVPAKPLAAYVPVQTIGSIAYTSGQLPVKDGQILYSGKVGTDVSVGEAKIAAQLAALNAIAAVTLVSGSIENITRIIKLTVFVHSAEDFTDQPEVANGASELMITLFGEDGKHARSAVGVAQLPRNASVEIELIAEYIL